MTTFKQTLLDDMTNVFMQTDEFGELATYTSPAGTNTLNVPVCVNKQSFITELTDNAGLGGTIVVSRTVLTNVEIHGKITLSTGEVFVITQILASDDAAVTVMALADMRISPRGQRF